MRLTCTEVIPFHRNASSDCKLRTVIEGDASPAVIDMVQNVSDFLYFRIFRFVPFPVGGLLAPISQPFLNDRPAVFERFQLPWHM